MMEKRNRKQPSQRQLRVGEELRHVLAQILERSDFRDPVLSSAQVTVTAVDASPDLRKATVFVVPLGGAGLVAGNVGSGSDAAPEATEEIIGALNRASAFIRRQVAGQMRLKYMPALTFRLDASFDHAHHIDNLLHDPKVAKDLAGGLAVEPGGAEDSPENS